MAYRAEPADSLRIEPLDDFTLIFHRRSGLTHLVTAPAPEILAVLQEGPLTRDAVKVRALFEDAPTAVDPGDLRELNLEVKGEG